jgi:hypothetical protein
MHELVADIPRPLLFIVLVGGGALLGFIIAIVSYNTIVAPPKKGGPLTITDSEDEDSGDQT